MPKQPISIRVDEDLLAWLDAFAVSTRSNRTALLESLIELLRAGRLTAAGDTPNPFSSRQQYARLDLSVWPPAERALAKQKFDLFWSPTPEGCWRWEHATTKPSFYWGNKTYTASRFSLALHKGPIEEGMQACHTCDNALCVNPEHLFSGTPLENNQDMWAKGRNFKGSNWKPKQPKPRQKAFGTTEPNSSVVSWARLAFPAEESLRPQRVAAPWGRESLNYSKENQNAEPPTCAECGLSVHVFDWCRASDWRPNKDLCSSCLSVRLNKKHHRKQPRRTL